MLLRAEDEVIVTTISGHGAGLISVRLNIRTQVLIRGF
jgi:hypothetical protein